MPIPSPAPYDSLETVTSLVRTLLGDFIQNIQPNNVGVVNVNAGGLSITWQSGNQFTALMNGATILINGVPNTIAMVTSPTTANLVNAAAFAANVPYSLVIPTGDIFADSQSYVVPTINLAWRMLQKKLADKGHPRLEDVQILTSLPIVANLDPGVEQYINWTGFYDGVTFWTPATLAGCPTLPRNFISPLKLKERQSLAGASPSNPNLTRFCPMHPAPNGLSDQVKGSYNRHFDWREDGIYLPGSILNMDIKARYMAYLDDIAPGSSFATTPVKIMRCAEALANYAASIFVTPRGSLLGPNFMTAGDMAIAQITNAYAKLQQRASYSRIAWGSRGYRARRRSNCN